MKGSAAPEGARVGCIFKGRRPHGATNREVTAPPSEAGRRRAQGPGAAPAHRPPPSALPNWAARHSPAQGIVFPACSRQASASKIPSRP